MDFELQNVNKGDTIKKKCFDTREKMNQSKK